MKRCPECRRDYFDDSLSFCLDDGSALLDGPSTDDPATAIINSIDPSSESATKAQIHTTEKTAVLPTGPDITQKSRYLYKRLFVVPVLLVVLGLAGFFGYQYLRPVSTDQINSIAVLPFVNKSGDPNSEYLSDGLAESLIYRLSQLPNLKVSPTSSVIRYKGKEGDVAKIANELGVEAVMTGRLAQMGDNLTISVELVDVGNNKLLWGEQYERKMSDLLTTQREIASTIVQKLALKLTGDDAKGLTKRYTDNNEAYQLYLQGRFYWNKRTSLGIRRSLEFFEQAIDKDPKFALAYVGVSDSNMLLGIPDAMGGVISPQESIQKASAAANKALEIDPSLAEAYASRGHVKWKERDWAGAEEDYKHSIELNANYPIGHLFYSIFLASTGRFDEGLKENNRAQDLDPLSIPINANIAFIYYVARRPDEAIVAGQKAVEIDTSAPISNQRLGLAYEQKGMFSDAIAQFQRSVSESNRAQLAVGCLAHVLALSGNRPEAEKLLAELEERSKTEYISSYQMAQIYVVLGNKERAFELLEKAYGERSIDLVLAKVEPKFDPLHGDPRFTRLLKKLGFPE